MRAMKDSGVEWLGAIPDYWEVNRTKIHYSNHKYIVGNEVDKYERLALTMAGVVKRSKEDSTGLQPEEFNGYQILKENELVFKLIDLQNISTSRIGRSKYTGLVSPAYIVLAPKEGTNSEFGEYYFLSMWQRKIFNQLGDNGVRSSLNAGDLLNVPYVVPPKEEQRIIVDYLRAFCNRIDGLVSEIESSIEDYKKYKKQLISNALYIGESPDVSKYTKMKIKNVCKLINGDRSKNYPNAEEFVSLGVPFLGADSLCDKYINLKYARFITREKYDSMGGAKIRYGDILYTLRGSTIGKNAIANFGDGTVASSLVVIHPERVDTHYLYYWLNSDAEYNQRTLCINGSTAPNLSADDVGNFVIFLPKIEEQIAVIKHLDKECDEIDKLINDKLHLIDELNNYKTITIYEYITGKRRVK